MINLQQANVLITGGSHGIGLGLAKRFIAAGSKVLITGRNSEKLANAAAALPGLQTFVNNVGSLPDREVLAKHVQENMPDINIIINNAGIQRRISLAADTADWSERQAEIDILLSAPVHLNHLLIPLLLTNGNPSLIVNVTSGGAYIPQVFAPVYSACKAALHSYTVTLRQALANTACSVVELIPPAVQTGLAGPGNIHGALLDDFCDDVFPKLTDAHFNAIGFGPTANLIPELSGKPVEMLFEAGLVRTAVKVY